MPAVAYKHDVDPKADLFTQIGDLTDQELCNNEILCAVYIAPKQMASGLWRPDENQAEDRFQSKVGLIVKMGPLAFKDTTGKWAWPNDMNVGDWIYFRVSDGWNLTVNQVLCRQLVDTQMRGRISHPDQVW